MHRRRTLRVPPACQLFGSGTVLDSSLLRHEIAEVVHAAYKIIAGKGATNYAVALAVTRIVESVLRDGAAVRAVSRDSRRRPPPPEFSPRGAPLDVSPQWEGRRLWSRQPQGRHRSLLPPEP